MHFHLPKPLHGWRDFAGEVGIIVVGVLIALGAEQLVEAIHDRHLAAETRSNAEAEIESNLGAVRFRLNAEACVQRRLDELHSLVDEWGRSGSFKAPSFVGGAPHAAMDFTRYDAAQSAGRLALLTNEAISNWIDRGGLKKHQPRAVRGGVALASAMDPSERP